MIRYSYLVYSFCLVLILGQVDGQTVIWGVVKDYTTGVPIPYATIVVTGTTAYTQSSFDGEFNLKGMIALPCSLSVSLIGYKEKQVIISEEKRSTIYLEEEIFQLAGLDVAASRILDEEKKDALSRISYDRLDILANPAVEIMGGWVLKRKWW